MYALKCLRKVFSISCLYGRAYSHLKGSPFLSSFRCLLFESDRTDFKMLFDVGESDVGGTALVGHRTPDHQLKDLSVGDGVMKDVT